MDAGTISYSNRNVLIDQFRRVRSATELLCSPLLHDDYQIQSIIQTSPPKWHIAHVSWFFEAFVLPHFVSDYKPFHPKFDFLFNSYYYTHGKMHPRPQRGMLSRPGVDEIYDYRHYVTENMLALINNVNASLWPDLAFRVILGLNHEQQHQELLLMDIKHNFFANPLQPPYRDDLKIPSGETHPMRWVERTADTYQIGFSGTGFAYDNETPRHDVLIQDHRLADRFITNSEYMEFMQDGGYSNSALWLADGWALIQQQQWHHPLYWQQQDDDDDDDEWRQFTLGGVRPLNQKPPA